MALVDSLDMALLDLEGWRRSSWVVEVATADNHPAMAALLALEAWPRSSWAAAAATPDNSSTARVKARATEDTAEDTAVAVTVSVA